MSRYQREHSGPNLSNGVIWIIGICGIAYIVFKIVSCNQAVKSASEYERQEMKSEKPQPIIIDDSTSKIDSTDQ